MAEMAISDSLFDDYKTLYIVSETLLSIFTGIDGRDVVYVF